MRSTVEITIGAAGALLGFALEVVKARQSLASPSAQDAVELEEALSAVDELANGIAGATSRALAELRNPPLPMARPRGRPRKPRPPRQTEIPTAPASSGGTP